MNKFLKKRAPEALITNDDFTKTRPGGASSPTSPTFKKGNANKWRKNKKQPETKPSIDLSYALPSTDEFRTSLLMPKLSARFSMLREQDDPSSILGKASDDSVLQPRRRSRMADFGFNGTGLSDIAEVSSLSGSIRPPFAAPFGRAGSYASEDGYGSDAEATAGGNVMTRSRPGEGNNLFGGRQKIYKIAGNNSTRSLGKAIYEDDVGLSAFQRYRRERTEEQPPVMNDHMGFDFGLDTVQSSPAKTSSDSLRKERSHSPPISFSDQKRSTASSSITSEARSSTAATSMTSPSINSAAPSPSLTTSQSSAMNASLDRNSAKTRRLYEPGLDQHMHEQQASALTRLNSLQRPRAGTKQLYSTKSANNLHDRPPQPVYALRTQSPTNASSQPARNFSVKKLHSSGQSPDTSIPGSPVDSGPKDTDVLSKAMDPSDRGKATALGTFSKPQHAFDEQQYLERQLQLHRSNSNAVSKQPAQTQPNHTDPENQRSSSDAARARSQSTSRKQEPSKGATSIIKNINKPTLPDTHRTFFGEIKSTESEDEEDSQNPQAFLPPDYGYGIYHGKWQPTVLPSVSEHPALRTQKSKASLKEDSGRLEPPTLRTKISANTLVNNIVRMGPVSEGVDSPTLGAGHQPLNGMVRHLRQRSDRSSIYPTDDTTPDDGVVEISDGSKTPGQPPSVELSRSDSNFMGSQPWDLDEADRNSNAQQDTGMEPLEKPLPQWQQELHRQHSRDASNATQQEREAFSNELAARRTAIQQSIRKQQEQREAQSRSNSPARNASGPFKALGMIRTKSSRETFAGSRDPSKTSRMLSMTGGNQSSTSIASLSDRSASNTDLSTMHLDSPPIPPIPNNTQHPAFQPHNSREWDSSRQHPATRSRGPSTERHNRSRSNSANTGGRSRSRTGPYRDDLERAMIEGTGSSTSMHGDLPFPLPRELTPRPSPDIVLDGSRPGMTSYFEQKNSLTLQTSAHSRLHVQGPSPIGHSPSAVSPMSLASGAPSASGMSTPAVSPGVGLPTRPPTMLRRKTISKTDISTPMLNSTTASFDTVDLPEGASLMNGIDEAPPIPPINPRRRGGRKFFGKVRSDSTGEERSSTSSDNNHSHASSRDFDSNGQPMPIYTGFHLPNSPERSPPPGNAQPISLGQRLM